MPWKFEQSTGKMFDPSGKLTATGYAGGNCGKNPEGKNKPEMQGVKSVGPLPQGTYTMRTPVDHTHLGPFAIPLVPDASNNMLGRGDFYVHGDTTPSGNASKGCVIMPRFVRNAMWASGETLLVTA